MAISNIEISNAFEMNIKLASMEFNRLKEHLYQLETQVDYLCREINEMLEYGEFSEDIDHIPKNADNRRREALAVLMAIKAR